MKITIGHLFYDLLNLYGERGNVLALENALKSQGIEVEIKQFSLYNEPWNLEESDVIYIGAGTEINQIIALNILKKYKDVLNKLILDNKFILATGNSIELFGKKIIKQNKEIEALNLLEFTTKTTDKRIVSECIFQYKELETKILGFENHQGKILGISEPLFKVDKGYSSDLSTNFEGIRKNNLYATYLLGPLLVRNPDFLEKICKDIVLSKDKNFKFKEFNLEIEKQAHDIFLDKYYN